MVYLVKEIQDSMFEHCVGNVRLVRNNLRVADMEYVLRQGAVSFFTCHDQVMLNALEAKHGITIPTAEKLTALHLTVGDKIVVIRGEGLRLHGHMDLTQAQAARAEFHFAQYEVHAERFVI